jgi:hypothetical protein
MLHQNEHLFQSCYSPILSPPKSEDRKQGNMSQSPMNESVIDCLFYIRVGHSFRKQTECSECMNAVFPAS